MDEDKNGYLTVSEVVDFFIKHLWQNQLLLVPPNRNPPFIMRYSNTRQNSENYSIGLFIDALKSTDFNTEGMKSILLTQEFLILALRHFQSNSLNNV